MDKKVTSDDTVIVYFKGSTADGFNFSSSGTEEEGFEVTLGQGLLLPIFESHLIGMSPGETKNFSVSKSEGLPVREDLIFDVERDFLPIEQEFEVGDDLVLSMPTGEKIEVTITSLTDDKVILDANPPVAGKDLEIEMKLFEIL